MSDRPSAVPQAAFAPSPGSRHPARGVVLAGLGLWRDALSPALSAIVLSGCRHVPSCSRYAIEAVERHGVRRGLLLAAGRLSRCHPLGTHGFDPVPPGPATR
jgi:putative membrane protein insertion efficiency factor